MKMLVVKQLNGSFTPAYDSDYEQAKKIKAGETVQCEIKKVRNPNFHKKFFALINLVYQNQDRFKNFEWLREQLTIEAGYYYVEYTLHGEEIKKAKSISFAAMDETEFSDLYNAVIDTIVKYFNFGRQDIIDNVEQFF